MRDEFNDPLWRTVLSGAQMLFVAFGALVLMPLITGLDPNVALFTAGLGTILFQIVTGRQGRGFGQKRIFKAQRGVEGVVAIGTGELGTAIHTRSERESLRVVGCISIVVADCASCCYV